MLRFLLKKTKNYAKLNKGADIACTETVELNFE